MLGDLLYSLREIEFLFNLFGYISFRSGLSLVTSFLIVLILMPHWVRIQKSAFPSGQPIRNDGPDTHYYKKGTPTLGGVLILFSIIWELNFTDENISFEGTKVILVPLSLDFPVIFKGDLDFPLLNST